MITTKYRHAYDTLYVENILYAYTPRSGDCLRGQMATKLFQGHAPAQLRNKAIDIPVLGREIELLLHEPHRHGGRDLAISKQRCKRKHSHNRYETTLSQSLAIRVYLE